MKVDPVKLRRAREERGWTQAELGRVARIGTAAAAVKAVQRGEVKGALSATTIRKLAAALDKPVEFFLAPIPARAVGSGRRPNPLDDLYGQLEIDIDHLPDDAAVRVNHARTLVGRTDGDPRERIQRAIDLLERAVELASPMTDLWATAQQLLAKTWFNHPNPAGVDHLGRARAAIAEAVRFRVKRKRSVPEKIAWADCLNDSAVILGQSPADADRREAVRRFQRVAKLWRLMDDLNGWAVIQRNIGNAWASLAGDGDNHHRRENLHRSIEAYRAALTVHTRRSQPLEYAKVAYSLANSLLADADLAGQIEQRRRRFDEAIAALDERSGGALAVLRRVEHPVDWANAQFNLASVYHQRSDPAADDLGRAVRHYGEVLDVFTPEVSATEYALTLLPLATAKEALADLPGQDRPRLLRDAIAHMKAVQQVFPAEAAHRRSLERLRKAYLAVRRPSDPAYSNIIAGLT